MYLKRLVSHSKITSTPFMMSRARRFSVALDMQKHYNPKSYIVKEIWEKLVDLEKA